MSAVSATGPDWLRRLVALPRHGSEGAGVDPRLNLDVLQAAWDPDERPLAPPVSLLSWLIRNLEVRPPANDLSAAADRRRQLHNRNFATIAEALELLRSSHKARGWHILEGNTYADGFVETRDTVVVIEGKRTEAGPTTSTTWMPIRHQMLRHMDAAWEIRGDRAMYGFFLVEADPGETEPPALWVEAAAATISDEALNGSLPHRPEEERRAIAAGFLGVTTWQAVCREFGIDPDDLPDIV